MIYRIIFKDNVKEFEDSIDTFLKDGWKLQGGISVVKVNIKFGKGSGLTLFQAITKESTP